MEDLEFNIFILQLYPLDEPRPSFNASICSNPLKFPPTFRALTSSSSSSLLLLEELSSSTRCGCLSSHRTEYPITSTPSANPTVRAPILLFLLLPFVREEACSIGAAEKLVGAESRRALNCVLRWVESEVGDSGPAETGGMEDLEKVLRVSLVIWSESFGGPARRLLTGGGARRGADV